MLLRVFILLLITITMTLSAHAASDRTDTLTPRVDALFQDFNQPGSPGASVAVIKGGKVVLAKGYGFANVEERIPCGTNTNFRLASVTKQFTAMAVMILAERRKLSLDERLTDFFPEFPAYGNPITLRHLLTHTSGLVDYEDVIPKGTEIPVLDREVLGVLMQQTKTCFPPGTKYRYSNSAYALLALVVEARSGNTFARFLKENVFRPLKMSNTLAYEQGSSVVPNRAYGYSPDAGGFKRTDQSLTSSVLGDGGVYSSVADLYQWDQALYTDKLVSRKMLKLAFTPDPATDHPDTGYGFGWFVGQYRGLKEIWHSGNSLGFTTRIARFPEKKCTVIILTNRNEAKLAEFPHRIADWYLFPND
jgi:CubicO group peptidase (beta-lactamase class C family)